MRNPSTSAPPRSKATPCCSKSGLKRGPWMPEEDDLLSNYINQHGEGRWRTLPKRAGLIRCGKSCRLRWMNYLRPSVKRGQIDPDEEDLILRLHRLLGNRWSLIAGRIPGRTDNEIKNYWNTHLSKKLIGQGIDPRTHKPLADSEGSSSKMKAVSNPNPNLRVVHPIDSGLEGIGNESPIISNKESNNDQLDHQYYQSDKSVYGNTNLRDYGQDDEINYCTDDVFSSFLNSLINEDGFVNYHVVQQQQQSVGAAPDTDPLMANRCDSIISSTMLSKNEADKNVE